MMKGTIMNSSTPIKMNVVPGFMLCLRVMGKMNGHSVKASKYDRDSVEARTLNRAPNQHTHMAS